VRRSLSLEWNARRGRRTRSRIGRRWPTGGLVDAKLDVEDGRALGGAADAVCEPASRGAAALAAPTRTRPGYAFDIAMSPGIAPPGPHV
jgi:hypothetical protein